MEYVTPEEKARLQKELADRIGRRKELSERIGTARELGDLKENAEYHAAREDQGMNEARIKLLEDRLASAVVADPDEMPDDMVFLNAIVKLKDLADGSEEMFKLVGESTGVFDLECIEVTPNSPMGQALMKARVGDTIRVDLPRGERRFEIVEIV